MKFQKIDSSPNNSTVLSADDIAKANRFEERRNRLEAQRRGPVNHEMSKRVCGLFGSLIAELNAKPRRAPRWREEREPAVPLTLEQMAELWGNNPVKLSPEALARPADGER